MDSYNKILSYLLLLLMLANPLKGSSHSQKRDSHREERENFLIITSINPEATNIAQFIDEFKKEMTESYPLPFAVSVETLKAKSFRQEAHLWEERMANILARYRERNIKAIICVGNEVWGSLVSQPKLSKDVVYLCSYASSYGAILPKERVSDDFTPSWINTSSALRRKSDLVGGSIFTFVPHKSIELIRSLYPSNTDLAFLCDNSYNGQAIRAQFENTITRLAPYNYHILDASKLTVQEIKDSISTLPSTSSILVGTWRVDKNGEYLPKKSLTKIREGNPYLPIFSLTGVGKGNGVIGGYTPLEGHSAKSAVTQLVNHANGVESSIRFVSAGNQYWFDNEALTRYKIALTDLPLFSKVINAEDPLLARYRLYLIIFSIVSINLLVLIVAMSIVYLRNIRLREALLKNAKELKEAKEMAEESDKLKSAFLANMSHEVRTPLNAIIGFSSILANQNVVGEERERIVKLIGESSNSLLTLIENILDISSLEADSIHFKSLPVELNETCQLALDTFVGLRREGVQYLFLEPEQPLTINSDPKQLLQVLLNLLSNANKHTTEGSIELSYSLVEGDKGNYVQFSVTDIGPGVAVEDYSKLFERFRKLDSYKEGAGLGLAISKEIVTKLGGEIWIDPNYSDGARFLFTHPI